MSLSARLTRQSGTSFYYAFRILPARKRRAIYALYSFCRMVDDCVDEPGGEGEAGLRRWLDEVRRCYAGRPSTELGRDLAEALFEFPIPRGCFEDIVAGCRMDLTTKRYPTFADLRVYCERVASAVGLAAIEVFGYADPGTREYAVELGVALQLTNILRDVAGDAARDRIYLPAEDLARFGVAEAELLCAARGQRCSPAIHELLAFQAERARHHYERARSLLPAVDRKAMTPAEIMAAVYAALLDEIARRGYPPDGRVSLSRTRKAWIALRTLLRSRRP
ncbi:MAG: squalene synthase HpnD [Acidobacteria bacterium]|nr:MAG: squalene synthase HpnD [Acidobacteriota bacterium]PYQ22080.1 MAG: squalene synthase HpnD [Acidobacteriota bacterium]